MKKNVVEGIIALLLTGILAFCCGYPTAMFLQLVVIMITLITLFGIIKDLIEKGKELKNQNWAYWLSIALALVGCTIAMLSARFTSPLWVWVGLLLLLVGGLITYFNRKVEKQ